MPFPHTLNRCNAPYGNPRRSQSNPLSFSPFLTIGSSSERRVSTRTGYIVSVTGDLNTRLIGRRNTLKANGSSCTKVQSGKEAPLTARTSLNIFRRTLHAYDDDRRKGFFPCDSEFRFKITKRPPAAALPLKIPLSNSTLMSTSESTKPPSPTQWQADQTPTPAIENSHSQVVSPDSETSIKAPSLSPTPNPTPNSNDQTHAQDADTDTPPPRIEYIIVLKPYITLSSFFERTQARTRMEIDELIEYEPGGFSCFVAHLTQEQAREMLLDPDVEVVTRNAELHAI
ncbi:hypothetical protein C0995_007681 [Termitomyces sp. Mi166|nr:hypothetical protein C0995_007681 [Termitomyces sp. Mi166\